MKSWRRKIVREAVLALVGVVVGGLLAAVTAWLLERRKKSWEAAVNIFREVIPFLRRELEIGPQDMPGRTVDVVGQQFVIHGEHPREAFAFGVESVQRWAVIVGGKVEATALCFGAAVVRRRDFIEAYTPRSPTGTPDVAILDDPQFHVLTAEAQSQLRLLDNHAKRRLGRH
jgi:hypothetical protein